MYKIVCFLCICSIMLTFMGCSNKNESRVLTGHAETEADSIEIKDTKNSQNKTENTPDWSDISENGLDEDKFLGKINVDDLEEIASELQSLISEASEEEKKNPDIIITEGYTRVFKKAQYQKIIHMGEQAEMPLYYIIYKSNNNGAYEHICATALSELTGLKFMDDSGAYMQWSSGKEYLKLFNEYMSHK